MRSSYDPDGRRLPVKLDSTSNGESSMGVLSHVPGASDDNPLDFAAAAATRKAADALDGSQRLLLHGRVLPTLPDELDGMARQVESFPVAGFKTYTQFGPGGGFFLDDERHGLPFIERARALKVRNICVHKGLPFGPQGYEYSTCRDIGPASKRFADMNFLVDYLNAPDPAFTTYGPRSRREFVAFRAMQPGP